MLYIIGLGLNPNSISKEGLDTIKKCKKIYLENYTVDFPYDVGALNGLFDKKIFPADRDFVESLEIIDEAKRKDVALLVYGSPLTATTHITLIQEAKESGTKCKIIHSSSILDAVAETGLQLYKFGKTASMPAWDSEKNFTPESFMDIVKENKSIEAHTLILIDIGLDSKKALEELDVSAKNKNVKLDKIIIGQALGTKNSRTYYGNLEDLVEKEILKPFCIIIPEKLHFVEKDFLESLR
jgi:diphthine synthase